MGMSVLACDMRERSDMLPRLEEMRQHLEEFGVVLSYHDDTDKSVQETCH